MGRGMPRSEGFIAEYFGGKGFDGCALSPCVQGQAGFAASLFEERGAVPSVFDRDLGQQQASVAMLANEQTVVADFDFFGGNRLWGRENTQLDFEIRSLVGSDGGKAIVVERGGTRGFRDGAIG